MCFNFSFLKLLGEGGNEEGEDLGGGMGRPLLRNFSLNFTL